MARLGRSQPFKPLIRPGIKYLEARTLAVAITESADSVAATINSIFATLVAITESADSVSVTLDAASASGGSSQHPYQPILTLGRMMGR